MLWIVVPKHRGGGAYAAATATADGAAPLLLWANSKTQWVPLSFR